jgi:multiple sugar transport system permease protein
VQQSNTESDSLYQGRPPDTFFKRSFLLPAVSMLLLLSVFPLLWSLGMSFTDFQRGGSTSSRDAEAAGVEYEGFLGLEFEITGRNYNRLLDDERLHATARNTLIYVFAGVTVQYIIGFGLAMVLNQNFFGRNIIRVIFLMPMMMAPVAAAYTGRMFLDSSLSPIADLLKEISHLLSIEPAIKIPWFTDGSLAPIAIIIIDSWQWIPFMTLILLAAMQGIPEEIYEAARVDGATSLQLMRKITFPILLPISVTVILIRGLEIFKIIDVILITTGGGPGVSTESLTMYIFNTALTFGNYGYAAAISYVLLLLVIIFATTFLFLARRITIQTIGEQGEIS